MGDAKGLTEQNAFFGQFRRRTRTQMLMYVFYTFRFSVRVLLELDQNRFC